MKLVSMHVRELIVCLNDAMLITILMATGFKDAPMSGRTHLSQSCLYKLEGRPQWSPGNVAFLDKVHGFKPNRGLWTF